MTWLLKMSQVSQVSQEEKWNRLYEELGFDFEREHRLSQCILNATHINMSLFDSWVPFKKRDLDIIVGRKCPPDLVDQLITTHNFPDVSDQHIELIHDILPCATCRANKRCSNKRHMLHRDYIAVFEKHLTPEQIADGHNGGWCLIYRYFDLYPKDIKLDDIDLTNETDLKKLHRKCIRYLFPCDVCRARLPCTQHEAIRNCVDRCEQVLSDDIIITNHRLNLVRNETYWI